ncbi:unnamed protein product [Thelazia callipaeda]|uniref:Zinc finger BED domain-containing protein 4 n=1 Tax=Thelazia callipaeda TaxID=103827 RepID=A0A0N5D5D9_THECL|nr:unnamed protein product [Thelazia callipaeda]
MIRHLRSCHPTEYQTLQAAKQNNIITKEVNGSLNCTHHDSAALMSKPSDLTSHSIENIITTTFNIKHKDVRNVTSYLYGYANIGPQQKKAKFDECCKAVDLRMPTTNKTNQKELDEKTRGVRENFWPDDHPDARRITDQIGVMMILDNQSPVTINRIGFRNLLRLLQPKYRLPSVEFFHKLILPRLMNQLKYSVTSQLSDLGNQQNDLNGRLNALAPMIAKEYDSGNSFLSAYSHEITAFSTACSEQNDFDRVVINSIRSAQNISQSFSHCIQLNNEESDLNAKSENSLSDRIDSFIKRIGECIFPQVELTDLLTRCYHACRHLEESSNKGVQPLAELYLQLPIRSLELADCVKYVQKNLERIHEEHKRSPIPMFKPFSDHETQFLSDLNEHIHSVYICL